MTFLTFIRPITPLVLGTHPLRRSTLTCALSPSNPADSSPSKLPPPIKGRSTVHVDGQTGERVRATQTSVPIQTARAELPLGPLPFLHETDDPSEPLESTRRAGVNLYVRHLHQEDYLRDKRVIVFAHGFSQRPANYRSMLCKLAVMGFLVMAPRVWIFTTLIPFVHVETCKRSDGMAEKLQTALLIDVARSVSMAYEGGARDVQVLGHSMGGGMLLALARFQVPLLKSVALLAPAAFASVESDLNPFVKSPTDGDMSGYVQLGDEMADVPVLLMQGKEDLIVRDEDSKSVFDSISAKRGNLTGYALLQKGTHVGFEDRLNVNVPLMGYWDTVLFTIVNLVVFGLLEALGRDTELQLESAKSVLEVWMNNAGEVPSSTLVEEVEATAVEEKVTYEWNGNI